MNRQECGVVKGNYSYVSAIHYFPVMASDEVNMYNISFKHLGLFIDALMFVN